MPERDHDGPGWLWPLSILVTLPRCAGTWGALPWSAALGVDFLHGDRCLSTSQSSRTTGRQHSGAPHSPRSGSPSVHGHLCWPPRAAGQTQRRGHRALEPPESGSASPRTSTHPSSSRGAAGGGQELLHPPGVPGGSPPGYSFQSLPPTPARSADHIKASLLTGHHLPVSGQTCAELEGTHCSPADKPQSSPRPAQTAGHGSSQKPRPPVS